MSKAIAAVFAANSRPHRCRPGGEGARFSRPRQPGGGQHRRDSAATA